MEDEPEGDPEELMNDADVDSNDDEVEDVEFVDLRDHDALNAWADGDEFDDYVPFHDAAPWVDQVAVAAAAATDAANRQDIAEEIDLFNYDINLPLEHGYLGQLDHLHNGRILYPEGTQLNYLPLVYLNGVILVPGQEIPFTFRHRALRHFFERVVQSDSKTFGIGYDKYGTTAEVRNSSFTDGVATIRAEGRQRFRVIAKTQEEFEVFKATCVILPEVNLPPYFAQMRTLTDAGKGTLCREQELLITTSLPKQVFRQFDDQWLMTKLRTALREIIEHTKVDSGFAYPEDPAAFSYFVLSCIPFSDGMKSQLLQVDCATVRLRLLNALLVVPFVVQCSHCSAALATRRDFLVMSRRGTGGTFVNPAGVVHEMFTFSRVSNVQSVSEWSDDFSWFPNYGWIIIRCRSCMLHLGWKYLTKNPNIHPKSFWGVTRTAIKLSFHDIAKENIAYDLVCKSTAPLDNSHWNPEFN